MGCTPDALVCDDSSTPLDLRLLLVEVAAGAVLLALVVAAVVLLLLRRRRVRRAPVQRVWVSAAGDVVRRWP